MQAKTIAIVAVLVAAGILAYRQAALGRQLDALSSQLGAAEPVAAAPAPNEPARPSADESHAERLRAIETDLARARYAIRLLEQATGEAPANLVSDQEIWTVMKEHGSKVMENQISYHRERWMDTREVALADFAKRYNLDERQSDVLWGLLSSEIDAMLEILRDPQTFENPEQAAAQWKKTLLDTDSAAHKVLAPQGAIAWDQTRFIERKLLWPWLPD